MILTAKFVVLLLIGLLLVTLALAGLLALIFTLFDFWGD